MGAYSRRVLLQGFKEGDLAGINFCKFRISGNFADFTKSGQK